MSILRNLVNQCRSYRRLYGDMWIPFDELRDMVDTARVIDSAADAQPLKYRIICDPSQCAKVFPTIEWVAALKDWGGSELGERPSVYIAIVCDPSMGKNKQWDEEITSRTIMLGAVEEGYDGCIIGSCRHSGLLKVLNLDPDKCCVGLLLALGKPKEEMVVIPVGEDRNTVCYRDESQTHYVPRRSLEDILIWS